MNDRWIIKNSPYEILNMAFKRIFPEIKYTAYFEPKLRDKENEKRICGMTVFGSDGEITIFVDTDLTINDSVEIFAHELAHAGSGEVHTHDEKWQKAFDALFNEYNKIGEEMFSNRVDVPTGEECSEAQKRSEEMGK